MIVYWLRMKFIGIGHYNCALYSAVNHAVYSSGIIRVRFNPISRNFQFNWLFSITIFACKSQNIYVY